MGCDCKDREGERHSCPYQEDINGNDDQEYCSCCDDCRHDCVMDI